MAIMCFNVKWSEQCMTRVVGCELEPALYKLWLFLSVSINFFSWLEGWIFDHEALNPYPQKSRSAIDNS